MHQRLLCLVTILALAAISGCGDDTITSPPEPEVVPDFPNGVGNQWVYAHYDSLTEEEDTVRVSITRLKTLDNGEPAKVWRCVFDGGRVDTHYVSQVGDTIKMYWGDSTEPSGAGIMTLLFPMDSGKVWTNGSDIYDSTTIVDQISLSVPAGWFPTAYHLERERSVPGYVQRSTLQYIPEIGIGWMYLYGSPVMPGPPEVNETWVLVDYTFPDT